LNKKHLILGFGQTGVSIAKHLHKLGISFEVMESRKDLKGIQWLSDHGYKCSSKFDIDALEKISKVYVSPGIPKRPKTGSKVLPYFYYQFYYYYPIIPIVP
jgi:UDP-N-acetylmuramoylalanine-D-glutamate ligase